MTAKKQPGSFYRMPKQVASEYPVVEGTRCVSVQIPDDVAFLPVLAAAVAALCNTWSSVGTVDDRRAYAEMWQRAYAATDWEGCMDCADVADCIDTSPDVQIAIENVIQQQQGAENPVSTNAAGANLLSGLDGCAFNNLWGAIDDFVDWLNDNNTDFLDRITSASTPAKRAAVLSDSIPGFTGAALGGSLSAAITFLSSQLKGEYEENYDTIYADGLKCELFCIAKENCTLTIRDVYLVLAARVGYTPADQLFYSGLIFTVFGEWTGTQFADVMMFTQMGAFLFMGGFGGYLGVNPVSNALAMGWDDPSDDWMVKCECPDTWTYILDSTTMPSWVEIPDGAGGVGTIDGTVITQTTGVAFGQDITGIQIRITFPSIQTITGVSIHQVTGTNIDVADVVNHFFAYFDAGGVLIGGTGAALPDINGEWDASYSEATPGVKTIVFQYVYLGTDQTMEWNPVVISGFGTNPFL